MHIKKYCIILILMLMGVLSLYSQESRSEIFVDFRVNSTQIDSTYADNAARLQEITAVLQGILNDSTVDILQVSFCGAASPEGSYQLNKKLAQGRLEALEKIVRSKVAVPDSIITRDSEYIPWDYLATMVDESDISHKEEILAILKGELEIVDYHGGQHIDSRILKLRDLDDGKVWQEMNRRFFSRMRNACVVFVTFKHIPPPTVVVPEPVIEEVEVPTDTIEIVEPAPIVIDTVPNPAIVAEQWERKLYVKTNALGWALAIANAAVEIDLCKHWSFNLPVYYSAWNYFSKTINFRTFAVQPEIRYWFSTKENCNNGWFMGAHFGLAFYNIATDGEYRIQDHDGTSPALGGGLAVGYRMPISKNNRWKMEFSIGAGAYKLHYDKFRNYHNGLLVNTEKKTYIGIDQVSVSLSYTFDLKRKGGAR